MDFGFSQEEQALRLEAREFVRKEWTEKYGDENWNLTELGAASYDDGTAPAHEAVREFIQKLVERGWWTMAWPKEYGGQEASVSTLFAFKLEMDYQGAPAAYAPLTAILTHGTPWQKEFFLPKIARGEISFGLGLTEPNAGSDLASVETRAVRDGDEYVINGHKIYQSAIPVPDYYYVLVRTDPDRPKHRGLSLFIVPTDTPGFSAEPMHDMLGLYRWHEEYFEDLRLPERYRLGEENQGWYIIMSGLQQNRANLGMVGIFQRVFDKMADSARTVHINGGLLAEDPYRPQRHGRRPRGDRSPQDRGLQRPLRVRVRRHHWTDCRHDPRLGWRDAPEGVADLRAARWPAGHRLAPHRCALGAPGRVRRRQRTPELRRQHRRGFQGDHPQHHRPAGTRPAARLAPRTAAASATARMKAGPAGSAPAMWEGCLSGLGVA